MIYLTKGDNALTDIKESTDDVKLAFLFQAEIIQGIFQKNFLLPACTLYILLKSEIP